VPFKAIYNEKELLGQVAQGSRGAFGELYKFYFPYVQRYVALFESAEISMDELTQDVFVRIWEKREKLSQVDAFRGYLFLVTRNVVFNYLRALKVLRLRQLSGNGEDVDGVPGGNDPEGELLFKQYYNIAMEAIEKLPAGRRKILKMSLEQGLSLDEIATGLNITRSGVKKQLYAATSFVRQYLQENGEMSLLLFVFLSLFEG